MAITLSTALKTARAQAIVTAAGANATIKFYTGSMPAHPGVAATGTLLGTLTCGSTLGTVTNGVLTFGAITGDTAADASGAWGYARIATSGGTAIIDVDVGVTGSGKALITAAESCVAGVAIDITGFSITEA